MVIANLREEATFKRAEWRKRIHVAYLRNFEWRKKIHVADLRNLEKFLLLLSL